MLSEFWPVILTTMLPVAELRGGIPLGFALGLDPLAVVLVAFIVNCLVFFPIFFGLRLLYKDVLVRWDFFHRLMNRAHQKAAGHVERWGILGLAAFVAVPLPVTGAWTGTAIAWLLGLEWKRSFLSICLGVLVASTIVTAASWGLMFSLGNGINGG